MLARGAGDIFSDGASLRRFVRVNCGRRNKVRPLVG